MSKGKSTAIWLGAFFVLALILRIGFGFGASYEEDLDRYLYSGNDAYYHDRTVNHILETGEHLSFDPALNFPTGAFNPNPPIYTWTTSFVAGIFDKAGVGDPTGLALNVMVGIWGALILFPVFILGRELFGRNAGLWAAFFMAVSAPHISRGVFGFADHDATTMFFITLAMMFLVLALKARDRKEYVRDWKRVGEALGHVKQGLSANKQAMIYSTLAGVALSATALTWKGYPYVLGVMAVAVFLQLVQDHLKNRDGSVTFAIYFWPMLLVSVIPLVYYLQFPNFIDTTIMPGLYVLVGALVCGLVLVPTRDLPSILVFPVLGLAAIIGWILMTFVWPSAGETVFTGLGYFQQTKLFSTIAEANRAELGLVAASFAFFTFVLAFWGLARNMKLAWKGDAAQILMFSWAAVAMFMAFAASRFVANAAPVFALLAAAVTVTIVARADFGAVRKRFRAQHGQSKPKAAFKSMDGRTWGWTFALAFAIVLPNIWLGVDAGMPAEFKDENGLNEEILGAQRFGAFGVSYGIRLGWLECFEYLADQDTHEPLEDRPGFVAWWDYGHWATDVGKHPTVADPFQNHYKVPGRFLASESESEAQAHLLLLSLNSDYHTGSKGYTPGVDSALSNIDPALLEIGPMRGAEDEMSLLTTYVNGEEIFDLYDEVVAVTGKDVGYFGVDLRMFPQSAQDPGIFYAPVYLANKNPDDFTTLQYQTQSGQTLTAQLYEVDKDGNSLQLERARFWTGEFGNSREYLVYGGEAYPKGETPVAGPTGNALTITGQQLIPSARFNDVMFVKAFGGPTTDTPTGDGLSHWRGVKDCTREVESNGQTFIVRDVSILQYFSGYEVSGTISDDANAPMAGADVTFIDGLGARHHVATTDANGTYSVLAPFGDDLNLVVMANNQLLYEERFNVTRDQAAGQSTSGHDIVIPRGNALGQVFRDLDGDGQFNASIDERLAGASVTLDGVTKVTNGDGEYRFSSLQAGSYPITVSLAGYTNQTSSALVPAGMDVFTNVIMTPMPSPVTASFFDRDGEAVPNIEMSFEGPETRTAFTNSTGVASTLLAPGAYTVSVSATTETVEGLERSYEATGNMFVPLGGQPVTFRLDEA